MTSGSNEVEAGMNAGVMVGVQSTFHLELLLQICLVLLVNVVHDWLPAVPYT